MAIVEKQGSTAMVCGKVNFGAFRGKVASVLQRGRVYIAIRRGGGVNTAALCGVAMSQCSVGRAKLLQYGGVRGGRGGGERQYCRALRRGQFGRGFRGNVYDSFATFRGGQYFGRRCSIYLRRGAPTYRPATLLPLLIPGSPASGLNSLLARQLRERSAQDWAESRAA